MQPLYQGKAKALYQTGQPGVLEMHFADRLSAYDGAKKAERTGKGRINNAINARLMEYLQQRGLRTHFIRLSGDCSCLVRSLQMLPVECIVRNRVAGSLARRLQMEEGRRLASPSREFSLKDDKLGDPLLSEGHITGLRLASATQVRQMRSMALLVNRHLRRLFADIGIELVDFKLEFGCLGRDLYLADEISPDSCRLWNMADGERLDKDLFRRDLGDLMAGYKEVAKRLGLSVRA